MLLNRLDQLYLLCLISVNLSGPYILMGLQEMSGEADHHKAHVLLVAPRYLLQDL